MPRTRGHMFLKDLNPHLICILCGGYFIDAMTIVECLHSFCHSCLIKYLENNNYCPICDVQIHKVKPYLNIKPDKRLQDIVYKLVPGLFQSEMKRRREFYAKYPEKWATVTSEERGVPTDRIIYSPDDRISLSLEYSESEAASVNERGSCSSSHSSESALNHPHSLRSNCRRYLQCPAMVTVAHLKKFVRLKFDLTSRHIIEIIHRRETLPDEYTLMDLAYIFTWKRRRPMRLFYRILYSRETINHTLKLSPSYIKKPTAQQTEIRSQIDNLTNSSAFKRLEEVTVPRKRKDTRPLKNRVIKKYDGIRMVLKQEDVAVSSKQDSGESSSGDPSKTDISMKIWKVSSLTEPVVPISYHNSTISRNTAESINSVTKIESSTLFSNSVKSFNAKDASGSSCFTPTTQSKDIVANRVSFSQSCINNNNMKLDKYVNDVKGILTNREHQVNQTPSSFRNHSTNSERSGAAPVVQKFSMVDGTRQSTSSLGDECGPLDMRLSER